jgi:hypothetical protein
MYSFPVCRTRSQEVKWIKVKGKSKGKGKAIPLEAWTGPEVTRSLKLPDFKTIGTWRWQFYQPYTPAAFTSQDIFLIFISVRLSRPQSHSATGRIISMKYFKDTVENWTRDLPAFRAVPQPTSPLRGPSKMTHFRMFYLELDLTGYTMQDQIYVPESGLNHILYTINILYLLLRQRCSVI